MSAHADSLGALARPLSGNAGFDGGSNAAWVPVAAISAGAGLIQGGGLKTKERALQLVRAAEAWIIADKCADAAVSFA